MSTISKQRIKLREDNDGSIFDLVYYTYPNESTEYCCFKNDWKLYVKKMNMIAIGVPEDMVDDLIECAKEVGRIEDESENL